MWQTGQISLTEHVYLPSYSVKCFSDFMLKHFMTSWNFQDVKFDCLENEKNFEVKKIVFPSFTSFFKFLKFHFRLKMKTSKNLPDKTFKYIIEFFWKIPQFSKEKKLWWRPYLVKLMKIVFFLINFLWIFWNREAIC